MEPLITEIRHAARALRRQPAFTTMAVLTLAVAIATTTAVFSVVYGVLLRPLPIDRPDRVVAVRGWIPERGAATLLTDRDYSELRSLDVFSQVGSMAAGTLPQHLTGEGDAERVRSSSVTANLFPLLGVRAALGRVFEAPQDSGSIVLSHAFWRARFGASRDVVGRVLRLHGQPMEIIGVMPASYSMPLRAQLADVDVWRLLPQESSDWADPNDVWTRNIVVARLASGSSLESAAAAVDNFARQSWTRNPERETARFGATITSLHDIVVGEVRPTLLVLMVAAGLVFLISCANISNLVIARTEGRLHELSVRAALGGAGWRLMRHVFAEGAVIAALAGTGGILLARVGIDLLVGLGPAGVPRVESIGIQPSVMMFALLLVFASQALCWAVPGWYAARVNARRTLAAPRSAGAPRRRRHHALVIAEVALSVVLLVGAGLLIRSFVALQQVELGYDPDDVLTFSINLPGDNYAAGDAIEAFWTDFDERISALGGVEAVGGVWPAPLSGQLFGVPYTGTPERTDDADKALATHQMVRSGYFEAMGIRLLAGRLFTPADGREAIIVDRLLAERTWPGEDPIGKRIGVAYWNASGSAGEVVGVVEHVRHEGLARQGREQLYLRWGAWTWANQALTVAVRAPLDASILLPSIRAVLREIDPALPIADIRPMRDYVAGQTERARLALYLVAVFGGVGLFLAGVGLYGVISYIVGSRSRELGIRVAVGATRRAILDLVLYEGLRLAAVGVLLGAAGARLVTGLLDSMLYGVRATDPATFATIGIGVFAIALAACVAPARRAARADPLVAFRGD